LYTTKTPRKSSVRKANNDEELEKHKVNFTNVIVTKGNELDEDEGPMGSECVQWN
jgi:hypothetical protein